MCLNNNPEDVKKFLKKNKGKKFVWAYKHLLVATYCSKKPQCISPYIGKVVNLGWYKGNSSRKSHSLKAEDIHRGIHVYTKHLKIKEDFYQVVIKVKCYIKDLIGVNSADGVAAFHKIYIPKTKKTKKYLSERN